MKVNTGELERQANELQAVAGKLNDIQDSVLRIARNLSREQFGERFRYPLNNAADSIGRRGDELKRMRTALRQIAQLYERTEMNITDEAESASVHHEQSNIGSIPIPGIGLTDHFLDRDYPIRPVQTQQHTGTPIGVPLAVVPIIRDLIRQWQERNRREDIFDRAMDELRETFRDHYGPSWTDEGAGRTQRMRDILERVSGQLDDAVDLPDVDEVADEISRIAREAINPDGNSGYHPPHNWGPDIPSIDPGDFFDRSMHDNTPPTNGNLADVIADGVQVNPHIFQPLGPGGQAPTAADIIRNAADTAADAFANAGISMDGRPIASLDPVGPGMASQIFSSIDGPAINIAESAPILGGTGNIDWTPWNP